MRPGPNSFYKCPHCERITMLGSISSGNTFGAILFSDGKLDAPMLMEFTRIVKCKKCGTFYWLQNKNKIEEYVFEEEADWNNVDMALFLSLSEYIEALNLKIYTNENEQKYLRKMLWWAFNDRIRESENLFIAKNDKEVYESNCIELIKLLNKNNTEERIMTAELYRNLGNYTECNTILETIEEQEYIWIKEMLKKECAENNSKVIVLRK
jgi:uncharacterized protein with PIN domain